MARRRGEHALLRVLGLTRPRPCAPGAGRGGGARRVGGVLGVALGYALAAAGAARLGRRPRRRRVPRHLPAAALLRRRRRCSSSSPASASRSPARCCPRSTRRAPRRRARSRRATSRRMLERVCPGLARPRAARRRRRRSRSSARCDGAAALRLRGDRAACWWAASLLVPGCSHCILERFTSEERRRSRSRIAQLRGAPGQAAVSLAAIVASFSLMAAMAIMVASFRDSLDRLARRGAAGRALLPHHARRRHRLARAGVRGARARAAAGRARRLPAQRPGAARPGAAGGRAARARPRRAGLPGRRAQYERRAGDPPPAWISEAVLDLYGFAAGPRFEIAHRTEKSITFVVAGVLRDYARQHGAIADRPRRLRRAHRRPARERRRRCGSRPGATPAAAMEALRALPGAGELDIARAGRDPRAVAAHLRPQLRRHLRDGGGGGAGRPVRPVLQPRRHRARAPARVRRAAPPRPDARADRRHARRRRRAARAARRAAPASLAGGAICLVLVHVVNRQSFNWSMEMHVPLAARSAVARCRSRGARGAHRDRSRAAKRWAWARCARCGRTGEAAPLSFVVSGTSGSAGAARGEATFLGSLALVPGLHAAGKSPTRRSSRDQAAVSARPRRASGLPHGVVVRHRLARRAAAASRSPSSARGRKRRARTRAASIRGRSCSRTPRCPIRSAAGCCTTSARRAPASRSRRPRLERTGVWIDDWRLELEGTRYQARIAAREFEFDFTFFARELVLQGEAGFSRKGHRPERRATTTAARSSTWSAGWTASRVERHRLARPRMVERVHGARGRGLGLVRHQLPRRQLADGLSACATSTAARTTPRRASR